MTLSRATKAGRSKEAKAHKQLTPDQFFFYQNAGYSFDPKTETAEQGHTRCAVELARAEEYARNLGWEFEWEFDQDPDLSWMSDEEREQEHEVLCCRIPDPENPRYSLASLCGISDPDSDYRRGSRGGTSQRSTRRVRPPNRDLGRTLGTVLGRQSPLPTDGSI
jgi:hypothetical protein